MLSPGNAQPRRLPSALIVMLLWLMSCGAILAAEELSSSAPIRQTDVTQAVETLRKDPNLAMTRQTRTLRWIKDDEEKPKQSSWMKWIGELFRWVAEIGRVFVWLLIALLVGMIILYLLRFTKTFEGRGRNLQSTAPTHVRDLDIRPESLPDDIGAAAWDLWEQGEHRGALSLLYRGLLSRLAHVHQVPIRHSSTEGDCLSLAEKHLSPERHSYIAQLIRTWQRAVYGGEDPPPSEMRALCERFAPALQAPQPESVSS